MSTTHPRIQVTPNAALLTALSRAETRWPDASRSELVVRLAIAGGEALGDQESSQRSQRLAAISRLHALGDDIYTPDELQRIREDWPA